MFPISAAPPGLSRGPRSRGRGCLCLEWNNLVTTLFRYWCTSIYFYTGILNACIVSLYMYIVNVCIECMHFECMHCESVHVYCECMHWMYAFWMYALWVYTWYDHQVSKTCCFQGYGLQILDIAKYPLFCTFWVPMVYVYIYICLCLYFICVYKIYIYMLIMLSCITYIYL